MGWILTWLLDCPWARYSSFHLIHSTQSTEDLRLSPLCKDWRHNSRRVLIQVDSLFHFRTILWYVLRNPSSASINSLPFMTILMRWLMREHLYSLAHIRIRMRETILTLRIILSYRWRVPMKVLLGILCLLWKELLATRLALPNRCLKEWIIQRSIRLGRLGLEWSRLRRAK